MLLADPVATTVSFSLRKIETSPTTVVRIVGGGVGEKRGVGEVGAVRGVREVRVNKIIRRNAPRVTAKKMLRVLNMRVLYGI